MRHLLVLLLILSSTTSFFSQEKKEIVANRTNNPPKIDGILNDDLWKSLPAVSDFNMFEPGN